jgi:serine/threonine protein kinase
MELVPGQTLAERLATGALRVEEVLGICSQIAEALGAAHQKGITHRDLKPANIKVTPEGRVKVLDFGLAKAAAESQAGARADAPTLTAMTQAGVILGTPAYMSPELVRGELVDQRNHRCDGPSSQSDGSNQTHAAGKGREGKISCIHLSLSLSWAGACSTQGRTVGVATDSSHARIRELNHSALAVWASLAGRERHG